MKNIIIAMSGGIDSSIAAFLVKKSGYNPIGISLNLISNNNETQNACCSHFSIKDAIVGFPSCMQILDYIENKVCFFS